MPCRGAHSQLGFVGKDQSQPNDHSTPIDLKSMPVPAPAGAEGAAGLRSMADETARTELLLSKMLSMAEQMLAETGEFSPFGGAVKSSGDIITMGGYVGLEHPPPEDVIDLLVRGFREGADKGEFVATALIYDARVTPSDHANPADAIVVELEHSDGHARTEVFPYKMSKGRPNLGSSFSLEHSRTIFQRR